MSENFERRDFLKAGIGAAGIVMGGYEASAKGFKANETIEVGIIGTGGRARQLMETLRTIPGVRISAVCDVWDEHLEAGRKLADPKAKAYKEHRKLLNNKSIDAVLIGTPDHLHVPLSVDACMAGKDVYVEKPLTHDLSEGKLIVDAQNNYGRILQVGMQQRSMPHLAEARDIIRSGQIGEIRKVHLTWNRNADRGARRVYNIDPSTVEWERFLGNAPAQPFNEYRFRNWRFFWDFGGGIFTDLMVHFIDVVHWILDLGYPSVATSIGNHFTRKDQWETPDTVQTLLQYEAPDIQVYFEGTFFNARNAAMMEFMGSEATLYCDRGRYEIHPELGKKIEYKELVLGSGNRGADFFDKPNGELLHLTNWLECIRSRKRPNAPAEAGVSAAAAAHLANAALRKQQVVRWGDA